MRPLWGSRSDEITPQSQNRKPYSLAGIAAGTFGTDWWIPLGGAFTAAALTLILYYILWEL